MPFTDLHSHILPGCDDGASDDAEFISMARAAVAGGTARMVATPHYDLESPGLRLEEVRTNVREHLGTLREVGIDLELIPGVEVRVNAGLFRMAKEGGSLSSLCLGDTSRYILVDLPLIDLPNATADILFQVQLSGFIPILAHPERNRYLATRPERIRELVECGVQIQVNSGSLEGYYGKTARHRAIALLKEGAARLVASDAHSSSGRSPNLSGAARILRRQFGKEAARMLLEVNPEIALADGELEEAYVQPPRRGGRERRMARRNST